MAHNAFSEAQERLTVYDATAMMTTWTAYLGTHIGSQPCATCRPISPIISTAPNVPQNMNSPTSMATMV